MLEYLRIKNFALIDDLEIRFQSGLTVMTGETGAGKSIIINALNTILGMRMSSDMIRSGTDKGVVEGMITIDERSAIPSILGNAGIDCDAGQPLILKREFNREGRSYCYINGSPTTLSILRRAGDILVDIHGQHEHQLLLDAKRHCEVLDSFGKLESLAAGVKKIYNDYTEIDSTIHRLELDEEEKKRRVALAEYAVKEIDDAALQEHEDIELEEEERILSNAEKLYAAVDETYRMLYENDNAAGGAVERVLSVFQSVEDIDKNLLSLRQKVEEAHYTLQDVIESVRQYKENITFSPDRLEEIIQRRELIQRLKKKYGESIGKILLYREQCIGDILAITNSEETKESLKQKREALRTELQKRVIELSGRRRVVAKLLEEKTMHELAGLAMEKTRFIVQCRYRIGEEGLIEIDGERYCVTENGIDVVEFLISPNEGEEPKPLQRIASGGELSRIMLALKTILAGVDTVPTLIFDEVDVGIGGKIAETVGIKLQELAAARQVFSITHLPQVAARADHHLHVVKMITDGRTVTRVGLLPHDERVKVLAAMMSGDEASETARETARELLMRSCRNRSV